MAISIKNAFCLTIISILLKRDLTSYNIYYDRVPKITQLQNSILGSNQAMTINRIYTQITLMLPDILATIHLLHQCPL